MARRWEGVARSFEGLPWWGWLLAINSLLVLATVAHHKLVLNYSIHFYLRQVDLAIEMNFAAWWSGVLLLGLGLLSYEIFSGKGERSRFAWLLLAIAFVLLSIDEIGSIHERIEDWLLESPFPTVDPYVPVAALGLLLIPLPLVVLARDRRTRKTAGLLLVGFLLLASIAVQERMEGRISWGDWWSVRIGLEEGTELLGMSLCYGGLVNHTWRGNLPKGWSGVLPNPLRMRFVPVLAALGLLVHLGALAVRASQYESAFSEHLLVWYPLALACVLSLAAFWRYKRAVDRGWWLLLSGYFLLYSAMLPYVLPLTTDKADAFFSDYVCSFFVLQLGVAIALFLAIHRSLKVFSPVNYLTIAAMVLLVVGASVRPLGMFARYALPGIFTFLLCQLFFLNAFGRRGGYGERI